MKSTRKQYLVLGLGRFGDSLARNLCKLGHEVLAVDKDTELVEALAPYVTQAVQADATEEAALEATYADFDQVLAQADVISCHMPYTPENHHIINLEAFRKMKQTAYFVNAARGPVMSEADLVTALKTGEIRGAATDVFEHEPYVSEELAALDNVVITPHIGSNVLEARKNMVEEALNGVFEVLNSLPCHNIVNRELLGTDK